MPDPTLMNFMQQKIDNPVSEQVRGQRSSAANDYTNMQSTLADIDMKQMQNDTAQKKKSLLENFQGKKDSPEFYDKMGSIDPDLVMKMQERAQKMDEGQREKAKEYFDKVGARAEMANTEELWAQTGFAVPFSQRDTILGSVLTFQQVMDKRKTENVTGQKGTSLMRNTKFLEEAGIPKNKALDLLLKSKQSGPDKFEQDLIKMFVKDITLDEDEAIEKARRLTEHYFPDTAPPPAPGSKPQGFQSGAGPSSSGKDYRSLM